MMAQASRQAKEQSEISSSGCSSLSVASFQLSECPLRHLGHLGNCVCVCVVCVCVERAVFMIGIAIRCALSTT